MRNVCSYLAFLCIFLVVSVIVSCAPPALPSDSPSKTPAVKEPATAPAKEPRERLYEIEQQYTLKNNGPGVTSRALLRLALLATREPYQKMLSAKPATDDYKKTEDEYGNAFAEFEFKNLNLSQEVSVKIVYQLAANDVQYRLERCTGPMLTQFLEPENWVESNKDEIVALAKELTKDKVNPCEKAWAFYDWIGNNINYSRMEKEMGALYCLQNKSGDCTEFSYLMIALCRATGIPARLINGLVYSRTNPQADTRHNWVEVYLPGSGWVPADPTWGRAKAHRDKYFARMSPDHIIFSIGHPASLAKLTHYFKDVESSYWSSQKQNMSRDTSWRITLK